VFLPEDPSIQLYGGMRDGAVLHVHCSVLAAGVYYEPVTQRAKLLEPDTVAQLAETPRRTYRWDGTANRHGHARYRLQE